MQTRRTFFTASALGLSASQVVAAGGAVAPAPYDLAAIGHRLNREFRHRQAFGSHRLADGAAAPLMRNSLNAYEFD